MNTQQIESAAFDNFCQSQNLSDLERSYLEPQIFTMSQEGERRIWQIKIQVKGVASEIATWFVKALELNGDIQIDPAYGFDSIVEVSDGKYQNQHIPESLREMIDRWVSALSEIEMEEEEDVAVEESIFEAHPLIPAWFTGQMMNFPGYYCLFTDSGQALMVNRIRNIISATDGSLWIDLDLLRLFPRDARSLLHNLDREVIPVYADADNGEGVGNIMSVNAAHIIAAMRLQGQLEEK